MVTAIYPRASTAHETMKNQRMDLERITQAKGWRMFEAYRHEGVSRATRSHQRPNACYRLTQNLRARHLYRNQIFQGSLIQF